jgi:hypothetical protein
MSFVRAVPLVTYDPLMLLLLKQLNNAYYNQNIHCVVYVLVSFKSSVLHVRCAGARSNLATCQAYFACC